MTKDIDGKPGHPLLSPPKGVKVTSGFVALVCGSR